MSDAPAKRRGRPKSKPEDARARQALIRAGLEHLTEKGYSAVGVDEILRSAEVPKGSFYHYFKSKADFGSQLVEAYHTFFVGMLERSLSNADLPPLERLRAFTLEAEAGMARHGFRKGCLVGNLGQEMGALPEPFRDQLVAVLTDWQERTRRCLAGAQSEGALAGSHDPGQLSAFFWIGWEGAVLRAKLERSPEPLRAFADQFFRFVTS